jgi:hypothetical protein
MRNLTLNMFAAAMFYMAAMLSAPAASAQGSQDVFVVLDRGPGGNIFRNKSYGAHAGSLLVKTLGRLNIKSGDRLTLFTFGAPGTFDHVALGDYNRTIEFAYRGPDVADIPRFMTGMMRNYSQIPAQSTSDLMPRLTDLQYQMDCTRKVTVIFLTNGREVGQIENGDFVLQGVPDDVSFCGQAYFVGLWANDPDPSSGLRSEARDLFARLAQKLGFDNVHITY